MLTVLIAAVVLSIAIAMFAVVAGVVSYIRTPDAISKRRMELDRLAARIEAL